VKTHLPQLDGLRGIAILIVVLGHLLAYPWGLNMVRLSAVAPLGVDLFFVLSGFLITGILLRSKGKEYYFRNFYARRALRTWPLYFLLLIFMWGVANGHIRSLAIPSYLHWQAYACYVQDLVYYQVGRVQLLPLAVTWSLAVEEQFYLIWPILVWLVPNKRLPIPTILLILIAPIARITLPHYGIDAYYNPICRFDAMAMGALLALWIALKVPTADKIIKVSLAMIGLAVPGVAISYYTGSIHIVISSFACVIFTSIVALSFESRRLIAVLNLSVLRYTGKISYCLYLCHTIAGYVIFSIYPQNDLTSGLLRVGLIVVSSYAIATASWFCFESQFLRLKQFFESRESRYIAALSRVQSI
jgi:peptidoglycan/LPS O-acetylase OafA/YrhL